ncbi:MAG TPA: hypothetical protein VFV81_09060 [Verrucomicrobiae bacterium]|nr:hypothetical protein [Verrucomicrobiae bacterium]
MKRLFLLPLLLTIIPVIAGESTDRSLMGSDTVVWTGVDYSLAQFIGPNDKTVPYNFIVPDALPDMYAQWNQLFLDERLDQVGRSLNKRVLIDLDGVTKDNQSVDAKKQIHLLPHVGRELDFPGIKRRDIDKEVASYKLKNQKGLGLVLIVDKLVRKYSVSRSSSLKPGAIDVTANGGAVYVVFFDLDTRRVISCERQVYDVTIGANFRNFWFGPIKDAGRSLAGYRPQ